MQQLLYDVLPAISLGLNKAVYLLGYLVDVAAVAVVEVLRVFELSCQDPLLLDPGFFLEQALIEDLALLQLVLVYRDVLL